jgi:hypothetical protein
MRLRCATLHRNDAGGAKAPARGSRVVTVGARCPPRQTCCEVRGGSDLDFDVRSREVRFTSALRERTSSAWAPRSVWCHCRKSRRSKRLEGWTQRLDSRPSFETRATARSSSDNGEAVAQGRGGRFVSQPRARGIRYSTGVNDRAETPASLPSFTV